MYMYSVTALVKGHKILLFAKEPPTPNPHTNNMKLGKYNVPYL